MTDPQRLLEDPTTSGRLLEALQSVPLPTAIPPEALGALGAALGHGALGTTTATAVPGLAKATLGKFASIVVATGVGAAGVYGVAHHASDAELAAAPPASSIVAPARVRAARAPVTDIETIPVEELDVAQESAAEPIVRPPSAPGASSSQLQAEAALLEGARGALATDPALALQEIRRYRARFSRPLLGPERDLVEIGALCRLGQTERATALVRRLLAEQPQGIYANRARALLERGCAK